MPLRLTVTQRAVAAGVAAAGLLIGAFAAGGARGDAATLPGRTVAAQAAAPGARITVTGSGTVSGTPDELMLYMGVQTNGSSVSAALRQANRAVSAVTRALQSVAVGLLDEHVRHCVRNAVNEEPERVDAPAACARPTAPAPHRPEAGERRSGEGRAHSTSPSLTICRT